jgi:hypothetical protein
MARIADQPKQIFDKLVQKSPLRSGLQTMISFSEYAAGTVKASTFHSPHFFMLPHQPAHSDLDRSAVLYPARFACPGRPRSKLGPSARSGVIEIEDGGVALAVRAASNENHRDAVELCRLEQIQYRQKRFGAGLGDPSIEPARTSRVRNQLEAAYSTKRAYSAPNRRIKGISILAGSAASSRRGSGSSTTRSTSTARNSRSGRC